MNMNQLREEEAFWQNHLAFTVGDQKIQTWVEFEIQEFEMKDTRTFCMNCFFHKYPCCNKQKIEISCICIKIPFSWSNTFFKISYPSLPKLLVERRITRKPSRNRKKKDNFHTYRD